jgi:hypothetical protein
MIRACLTCREFFDIPDDTIYDLESYVDILRIDGRAHQFTTGRAAEALTRSIIAEQQRGPRKSLGGFNAGEIAALLTPAPKAEALTLDSLFAADIEVA